MSTNINNKNEHEKDYLKNEKDFLNDSFYKPKRKNSYSIALCDLPGRKNLYIGKH